MLEHIARHKGYIPIPEPPEGDTGTANGYNANGPARGRAVARAGAGRLRDAIVFGYMMQRHRARGKVHNLLADNQRKREKSHKKTNYTHKSSPKEWPGILWEIKERLLLTRIKHALQQS